MSQGQGRRRPKLGHGSRSRIHRSKRRKQKKYEQRNPRDPNRKRKPEIDEKEP